MRAPLGNSIRTLLLFGALLALGVAIWWLRRPDDLTLQLGAREWVITEVDGEPATNAVGTVSTFVLDGTGEVRGAFECNTASGTWTYDRQGQRLDLEWESQTMTACPQGVPQTYLPASGRVALDGGVLRIDSEAADLRAVALADHAPLELHDLHGTWISGEHVVEIGEHGRFDVDECRGAWTSQASEGATVTIEFDEQPSGAGNDTCALDPVWFGGRPMIPVGVGEAVFLHDGRTTFPLDRSVIRLDPAPANAPGTPIAP